MAEESDSTDVGALAPDEISVTDSMDALAKVWEDSRFLGVTPKLVSNLLKEFEAHMRDDCVGSCAYWLPNHKTTGLMVCRAQLTRTDVDLDLVRAQASALLAERRINCVFSELHGWLVVHWHIAVNDLYRLHHTYDPERKQKPGRVKYT